MEITQYLNELVAMIPAILQYVVPGLLMLWIYNRLLDKQLPQHYLVYSVVISFLLMQEVTVCHGLRYCCRSFCYAQKREN